MCTLGILLLTITSVQGQPQQNELHLLKRGEVYLYKPALNIEPYSKSPLLEPYFCRAATGEFLMIERGIGKGMAYFFSSNGELRKIVALNTRCAAYAQGSPGNLGSVLSVFVNSVGEFGVVDQGYRLSLWDSDGNLTFSMVLPTYQLIRYYYLESPVFDHKTLASGLLYFNTRDSIGNTEMLLLDYENPASEPKVFPLRADAFKLALSKGAMPDLWIGVAALSSGNYACNINLFPEIYIVSRDGTMLTEDTAPPHFHSLMDAESLAVKPSEQVDSTGHLSEAVERWCSSWTRSYPACELSQTRLVVPRVLYPTSYLDIYSYSDSGISYLGYVPTQKPFLFADSSGIYLEESRKADKVVVGKYAIVSSSDSVNMAIKKTEAERIAAEVSGIRKVSPNSRTNCSNCPRKKDYKGNKANIRNLKLLSPDSVEYLLTDSLTPGKDHLILFSARLGLVIPMAIAAAENYLKENPDLDFLVVLTHPYPEEFKETLRLIRLMQTPYRILTNIDEERLKPLLKSPACFLVVSKDGVITASAEWPNFVPQPR